MSLLTAFLSGALFASGLVLSGMVMPSKVMGFLDVAGAWDPTLAFVMGGALLVYAPLSAWITRRRGPAASSVQDPPLRIDGRLVAGAAIFGVGWGLSGMCPGPAIVVAGALVPGALVFVAAMMVGAYAFRFIEGRGHDQRE